VTGQRTRLKQRIAEAVSQGDEETARVLTDRLRYLREKDKQRAANRYNLGKAGTRARANWPPSRQRAALLLDGIDYQDLVIEEYQQRQAAKIERGCTPWVVAYYDTQIRRARERKARYEQELWFIRATVGDSE
jgi:hypothetical protein